MLFLTCLRKNKQIPDSLDPKYKLVLYGPLTGLSFFLKGPQKGQPLEASLPAA